MSENYCLLIITPKKFSKTLHRFVVHKENIGITTKLVTLEEIYKKMNKKGADEPEKIKLFVKYALEKWNINYLLLVGGNKHFPVRYCYNASKYTYKELTISEEKYISDLYFADIYDEKGRFSSWDTNNSGQHGVWNGKNAEDSNLSLYPDLCVGRIPCNTNNQLKDVLNKIILYETQRKGEWFKKIVTIAGDTYPWNNYIDGEIDVKRALEYMKDFESVEIWASKGNISTNYIIKELSKGCGFVYFVGHGCTPLWVTHPPYEGKWTGIFSLLHILLLSNTEKLPITIAPGCRNSAFDVTTWDLFKNPKTNWYSLNFGPACWNWLMLRKPNGGSVATLGSSGIGYIESDGETGEKSQGWSYIGPRFFYEFKEEGTKILGKVWKNVISDYLETFSINWNTPSISYKYSPDKPRPDAVNAKTVQECILFGDPSLKIGGY